LTIRRQQVSKFPAEDSWWMWSAEADFFIYLMKSKQQKIKELEECRKLLEKANSLILFGFSKIPAIEFTRLRKDIKKEATLKIIKKRLLKIGFREKDIEIDPREIYSGQLGTIFVLGDIGKVILKMKDLLNLDQFKLLGIYDLIGKEMKEEEIVEILVKSPSRENLLGRLIGLIGNPIYNLISSLRSPLANLLYILNQRSKK